MKRFLALAALVLGLAACQTEPEGLDVIVGGEVDTVVSVSLPEATRATSDVGFNIADTSDNYEVRYILEIYLGESCQRHIKVADGASVAFPVRLAPGRDYTFVAWADIVEKNNDRKEMEKDRYYNTQNGLDQISIIENTEVKWNAMDESRDAFTAKETRTGFSAQAVDLHLKRPFAKLRVVATDLADVVALGLTPATATITYSQAMPCMYNALEQEVTAEEETTRTHNITYDVENHVYDDATGEFTLFADYFFADANYAVAKFSLNVYADAAQPTLIKGTNFNTDIFVEANKLTTIKGDVLTTGGNVSIKIENDLGELETINYADSAETLQEIINNAPANEETNITLGGDIDLNDLLGAGIFSTRASETSYGLLIAEGKSVVLDLNGHTIRHSVAYDHHYGMIQNNGTLTIEDNSVGKTGTISFEYTGAGDDNFSWGSYTIINTGTLVVNGGTIMNDCGQNTETNVCHMYCAIQQSNGITTINGGVISTPTYRSARINNGALLINGGTFEGQIWMQPFGESSITIKDGNFAPRGADGSSVFVENGNKTVACAIEGGFFNTKIGAANPFECIVGGTFTTFAKENTNEGLLNSDYEFTQDGENWVVTKKPAVAKIGDVEYTSLNKAVAAVEDGETITLVADEVFTEKNYYDNGGWKDGLGYAGDKSFTIDLDGKTISQNGSLNDYLIWIKNVGSKANTITIKNGTLNAGTTAFCALCTASSHDNLLTINLENITLINKNSNGSTVKVRAGSVVNVKAGTKIIGNDSYLGIENWNATVNIYDGVEIYMNGASSYNGCLVGVGGNGTINVYGGYGKGVSGGLIAMTSGGTINVSGGEWIANTDGTYANSNKSVLVAQSDKQYNAGAGNAIVNVTGGTFKGGYNCYGNAVGDAQINIKGGNFNANPTNFLVEGCEANETNGIWTVRIAPVAKISETEYETLEAAVAAAKAGDTVTLLKDVTLTEELQMPADITLNGNDKQINGSIYAGGNLTFAGHTKVTSFSASYYNRVITIGEGACLEVTGGGRVSLAYGNTFNITGSIENAKTADKANVQPSLIIPAGISITGGSDATMNVTNAYVKIGSTTSKDTAANGKFTLNFNNAIAEFTNQLTFAEPKNSLQPTFNLNIKNSVLTTGTKLCFAAPNCNTVIDNSNVTMATYFRNSGKLDITNGSVVTGSTIQFGENGGNNGATTVNASTFTINASSAGHALDGKGTGSLTLENGATATVTYYKDMTINVDETSTLTGTEVK